MGSSGINAGVHGDRQKAESRLQKFQTKIRSDFLLFVMIVHKASQTVLSVFFAAIVAIVSARGPQTVTCGSVVKLMNVHRSIRLHSHDDKDDVNSHWAVKGPTAKKFCDR